MTLCIETLGSGPPIGVIHGWGAGSVMMSELARGLAQRFRVHLVDLPGYGRSPMAEPWLLESLAEQLGNALPDNAVLVGWSLGAQLAMQCAIARPGQVRALVLIGATPCFVRRAGWEHAIDRDVFERFGAELEHDCAGVLRRFLAFEAMGEAAAPATLRSLRMCIAHSPAPAYAALKAGLRVLQETDLRDALGAITHPTLVLHGTHDAVAPHAAGNWLAHALPHARLHSFDGAGHAPVVSRRDQLLAGITEFLDG